MDATQAILFRQLREHYQKRDRLRLIVDYRKKYLGSLVRGGGEKAKQTEANYEQAKAQSDQGYEERVFTQSREGAKTQRKGFPIVV